MNKKVDLQFNGFIDVYFLRCMCIELNNQVQKKENIINELEKYLIEQVEKSYSNDYDNVLDKLDELKGDDKD